MAELSAVEKALLEDRTRPAAERFQERMRAVRRMQGLPVPEELEEPPADGVRMVAMTPALLAFVEELLGDRDDLRADALRLACDLPLLDEKRILAGQAADGGVVSVSDSLCSRTPCPRRSTSSSRPLPPT
ncbi:hypothetical protein ABZ281_36720 [Streptomyces sp. NPDC006265]|uniref:hypothetical protein n=1 Tax=Streptomyces sp. NPDC006265 TaxID=3156740 RepID=UPI0033B173F6